MTAEITNKHIYQEIINFRSELKKQYQLKSLIALAALVGSVASIIILSIPAVLTTGIALIVVSSLALYHYFKKHQRESTLLETAVNSLTKKTRT